MFVVFGHSHVQPVQQLTVSKRHAKGLESHCLVLLLHACRWQVLCAAQQLGWTKLEYNSNNRIVTGIL